MFNIFSDIKKFSLLEKDMYKKMFSKPTGQSESGIQNHPESSPSTSKYCVLFKHNGRNFV